MRAEMTQEDNLSRRTQPLSTTMDEDVSQPITGSNGSAGSAAKDAAAGNKISDGADGAAFKTARPTQADINRSVAARVGMPAGSTSIAPHKEPEATGLDRSIKAYRDWLEAEQYRPESPEERAKRERKERSRRIISAVGDGISALSNLFFTTHYAPSSYKHEQGLSANLERHLDKLKAERQQKADRYYNYAIQLGRLEEEKARMERDQKRQDKADEARDKAAQQADQRFQWELEDRPLARDRRQSEADYAKARAAKEQAVADNAAAIEAEKLRSQQAQTQQRKAAAGASNARAGYYNRRGSTGAKKHHFRGKEYISEKDYTKDVTEAARAYNERHKDDADFEPIITEDMESTAYGKRRSARKPEEFAGEVERRLAEEDADRVPPSRRKSNNDNKPPYRR